MDHLIVLTVSTDQTDASDNFEKILQYYGYDYHLLARGEKFMKWQWRTQKYIDGIEKYSLSSLDIIVLCDSNDLFFVDHVQNLKNKIEKVMKKTGKDIIVGGEAMVFSSHKWKSGEKRNAIKIMNKLCPNRRSKFPNGGCILGKRDQLLQLLRDNLVHVDDQNGYLRLFIQNPNRFTIDFDSEIIGNVPKLIPIFMHHWGDNMIKLEKNYWDFSDREGYHAINKISKSSPSILHFSGNYYEIYNQVGNLLPKKINFKNIPSKPLNDPVTPVIIVFVTILIIIIVILLVIFFIFKPRK